LDVGFIVQVKGLLAEGRGLAVELVPRDVPLLLLVRRRVEALRHVAGLTALALFGRLAASPIPDGFGRRHPWRGDCMTGKTEVRLLEDIQVLRIVRLALKEILVAPKDGPTRLQLDGGMAFHIWVYRLDEMALDAADPFERQVSGDDLLDHGINQVREYDRLRRVAVEAIALVLSLAHVIFQHRSERRRDNRPRDGRFLIFFVGAEVALLALGGGREDALRRHRALVILGGERALNPSHPDHHTQDGKADCERLHLPRCPSHSLLAPCLAMFSHATVGWRYRGFVRNVKMRGSA